MKNNVKHETRRSFLLCILVLGLVTAIAVLPAFFHTKAAVTGGGLFPVTRSHEAGIDDYDIRLERDGQDALVRFREQAGTNAAAIADLRQEFVRAERVLRSKVESLAVDYRQTLRAPEVIGPRRKGRH